MCCNSNILKPVSLMIDTLENQFDCVSWLSLTKAKIAAKEKDESESCFVFTCFVFRGMKKGRSEKKIKVTAKLHGE